MTFILALSLAGNVALFICIHLQHRHIERLAADNENLIYSLRNLNHDH